MNRDTIIGRVSCRDCSRDAAIASNFAPPLYAAGIDAKVRVRFPGEPV